MKLKTAAALGLTVGIFGVGSAFATFARVESMGKNTTYIMDDVSIFDNPANINLYPNYLIGGFGPYLDDVETGTNKDPQNPTFGGIFSLSLGSGDSPDPRISIGGLFGRKDATLFGFLPDYYIDENGNKHKVPNTVTNFDGFLGGTLSNGNAMGLHIYIAHQDGGDETKSGEYQVDQNAYASIIRADAGINLQLSNTIDFELSGGLARVQYGPEHKNFFDDGDFSYLVNSRAFFALDKIDGEIVPAMNAHFIKAPGMKDTHAQVGLGINVGLDRGFFWLGGDFVWNKKKARDWIVDYDNGLTTYDAQDENGYWDERKDIGGIVSFGIERNIWFDWFVIRVGGQKAILYTECDQDSRNQGRSGICTENGTFFSTNPVGNGKMDDHVGWGFGINIEEKLKIDVTIAEDFLFRNPFQGEGRWFSRLDATYSF